MFQITQQLAFFGNENRRGETVTEAGSIVFSLISFLNTRTRQQMPFRV